MEKVFKDKIRATETIASCTRAIKEIVATQSMPKLIDGFCDDCNAISGKIAIAHNSTMHYNIANEADYLSKRIHGMLDLANAIKLLTDSQISHSVRGQWMSDFTDRLNTVTESLKPKRTPQTTSWEEMLAIRQVAADFRSAVVKVWYEEQAAMHQRFMAVLQNDVNSVMPLPTINHDAFVKRVQSHDYYYSYSDDQNVWRAGTADRNGIDEIVKKHPHYAKIWAIRAEHADGKKGDPAELYKILRLQTQQ